MPLGCGFDKVYIWDSKSLTDRTVPLPQAIKQRLNAQVDYVEGIHAKDVTDGYGSVSMPYALERKYPKAKHETKWQFLFPMRNVAKDPRSSVIRRHHVHEKTYLSKINFHFCYPFASIRKYSSVTKFKKPYFSTLGYKI